MNKFKICILNKLSILYKSYIFYLKLFNIGLEIYYNHTPLLCYVDKSILLLNYKSKYNLFYINKSLLEFKNNKIMLITDILLKYEDIDKNYIIKKKNLLEKKILKYKILNNLDKYLYYINKKNMYLDYLNIIKLRKYYK